MLLLISPAAGWKDVTAEVQEGLYFLMSNPPKKVNTTGTTRFGGKETLAGLLTPLFTTCSNYCRQEHTQAQGGDTQRWLARLELAQLL